MSEVKDWVIVPKFATESMIQAGIDTPVADSGNDADDQPEDYKRVYSAMLEAAPKWSSHDLRVIPIGQIRTDIERANCIWFGQLPKHGTDIYAAHDFDAQRLRAHTAEAALKIAGEDAALMLKDLDAAEQRIAELTPLIAMAKELLSTISMHQGTAPKDWCESFKGEVSRRIATLAAALNPNPEAESHE